MLLTTSRSQEIGKKVQREGKPDPQRSNSPASYPTIIQTVCVGLGILGLSIWGIGKIARPVFPQISALTANYMGDLMIGIAVVFVASQIVEGLASAMGGAGG